MSFLHSLNAVGSVTNIEDVLNKWDPSFVQTIIGHFNANYMQFSVVLGIPLEKIKVDSPTNALYAIAMMTSVKLFMHGHMKRIESLSYPQIHSQRLERIKGLKERTKGVNRIQHGSK
jgi:hypothetical protein